MTLPIRCPRWLVLLLALLAAGPAQAQAPLDPVAPTLVVFGLTNGVDEDAWQDARVGLGLRNVLAELFFDTGVFVLLEDQPEIQQRLDTLARAAWMQTADAETLREGWEVPGLAATHAAYGRVIFFGRPRSRLSLGPLSRNTQGVQIRVEVTLETLATGRRLTERGEGKAKAVAHAAIFTYREDAVALDQSTVGMATREALQKAVAAVMKKYWKEGG